jgi:molecular chaperone DnaJ
VEKSSFEILGVTLVSSDDEIRSAYRKLAIRFHPDKNQDDPTAADAFRQIVAAYESIRDEESRKKYNNACSDSQNRSNAESVNVQVKSQFDLADALRTFMGSMRYDTILRESFEAKRGVPGCGSNVSSTVQLTLHEIVLGVQKTITCNHLKVCSTCKGTGSSDPHFRMVTCKQCGGHGIVRVAGQDETIVCPVCKGTAKEIVNPCAQCNGSGQVSGESTVTVRFPQGIGEGNVVTMSGKGNAGFRGAGAGDLLVYIEEIADPQFSRQGYDLETDVTIPVLTAILGGRTMALTLDGETVSLRIPAGTQPETLFALKSYGLPVYRGVGRGNLYVRVHVAIPEKLTEREKQCYESLAFCIADTEQKENYDKLIRKWLIRQKDDVWIINGGNGAFNNNVFEHPDVVKLLEMKRVKIAVDLSSVNLVHSLAIGLWIKIWKKLQSCGGEFFIINPNPDVMNVLADMNMDSIFKIVNDS